MRKIQLLKKWILISMLFVGISLAVYAVTPQNVFIENMFIKEVGTTYVDIAVTHYYAERLTFEVTEFETDNVLTYSFDVPYNPCSTIHRLDGLTSETIYNVNVTAIGIDGDTHHLWMQVWTEL